MAPVRAPFPREAGLAGAKISAFFRVPPVPMDISTAATANRITIALALLWFTVVVLLGVIERFIPST